MQFAGNQELQRLQVEANEPSMIVEFSRRTIGTLFYRGYRTRATVPGRIGQRSDALVMIIHIHPYTGDDYPNMEI